MAKEVKKTKKQLEEEASMIFNIFKQNFIIILFNREEKRRG